MKMKLNVFSACVIVCLLFACNPSSEVAPNIILIMADDLGYETLGCNGSQDYQTPNLDRLASEGMRFTHAYSTPLCTPTRVQLMTGKYNFRNYVGFGLLDPQEKTFGNYLKEGGYSTAIVGKWQLWGNSRQRELFQRTGSLPDQVGFEESCLWQVKEKYGERFKDPYVEINGDSVTQEIGGYGPDLFVTYAKDFISRKKQRPFFLYYPMVLTHAPFRPTPDQETMYQVDSLHTKNDTTFFRNNVAYMDKLMGELVNHLAQEGLLETTLLLFIGDNGTDRGVTSTWEGIRVPGRKGYPEEYGTHVPMIAYWPGTIDSGQVNENLIDFTDFLPSLLDVAQLPSNRGGDGISFYPQLMGKESKVRDFVFCHYAPRWGKFPEKRYIHDKEWKLFEGGPIFHIASDPEEKTPLNIEMIPPDAKKRLGEFSEIMAEFK